MPADEQIEQLIERIKSLRRQCLSRSASRVARELKRLARQERRVVPYLFAHFFLMNDAQSLLEPEAGAEVAIEAIVLLESEEKARQLQPDFPEEYYARVVQWMTACSYDNLAKHVAQREGYNSDGVHGCINDGMQVCRRTGKLECLTCFREYATDVYRASDDLEMALHHARFVASHTEESTRSDRRWVGHNDVADLLLLSGQLEAALEAARHAASVVDDDCHNPLTARRVLTRLLESVSWMRGEPEALPSLREELGLAGDSVAPLADGENLADDLSRGLCTATIDCCKGDFRSAIETLAEWDRELRTRRCLDDWFETRLRLIATCLLNGQRSKAEALARELEARATPARDYLSLRRMKGLLEGTARASPIAAVASLSSGPFGADRPAVSVADLPASEDSEGRSEPAACSPIEEAAPQSDTVAGLRQRIESSDGDPRTLERIFEDVRAVDAATVSHGEDAAWLLYLGHMLARWTDRLRDLWEWARGLVEKFPQHAGVVNLTADIADSARQTFDSAEEAEALIPAEQVEAWFRRSLDLDSTRPNNYARAGAYYQSIGKTGEAERCLARAFRLARDDSRIALSLAEIYSESERPRDALSVLDLCLREGSEDPRIHWQAAMIAPQCQRWESVVTYLDRFDQLDADQPWSHYYRAWALLELGRPETALEALEIEARLNPNCPLPVEALRVWANSQKQQLDLTAAHLRKVLSLRLSDCDDLTHSGLTRIFARLDTASLVLPEPDPARQELETRLLQTGLAPDELFQRHRTGEPADVRFFVCRLLQELDDSWPQHPGCLHGQAAWKTYEARWGVLADSEDEALTLARHWQRRCHPGPAQDLEVSDQGGPYQDVPGVLWQSAHFPASDSAEQNP